MSDTSLLFELISAARSGNLDALKACVAKGCDASSSDYDNRTALHLAAAEGKLEIVQWLVEEGGVDVNTKDRFGNTPIFEAQENMHQDVFKYLLSRDAKYTTSSDRVNKFCNAAKVGDVASMERLLGVGTDINATCNSEGHTPLHIASGQGQNVAVEFLLKNGAKVDSVDKSGIAPLQEALRNKHLQTADILLKAGAASREARNMSKHSQFRSALQNTLGVICSKSEFVYGIAWLEDDATNEFSPSSIWYATQQYHNALSYLDNLNKGNNVAEGIRETVRSVVEIKEPLWSVDATDNRISLSENTVLRTALFVPLVYGGSVMAVLEFRHITRKEPDASVLEFCQSVVSRIASGFLMSPKEIGEKDTEFAPGRFREQMEVVYRLILEEQVFNADIVREEVNWFYNELGLDEYYFNNFSLDRIAKHLHTLIAAKKLAQTTGTFSNIAFTSEDEQEAFYIRPSHPAVERELEQRIEQKYLGEGYSSQEVKDKSLSTSVASFRSQGAASKDAPGTHISLYFVDTRKFLNPDVDPEETDLTKLATGKFLRERASGTARHAKYAFMNQMAVKQFAPVVHVFEREKEDDDYHMMIAYKNRSTHSFFSSVTELFRKEKLILKKKYRMMLSNGVVLFSFHFKHQELQNLQRIAEEIRFLYVLPRTNMTPLYDDNKLTLQEVTYAYCVWKFVYHFITIKSPEYVALWNALIRDEENKTRLLHLKRRIKSEVATEARIRETFVAFPHLVKILYADFAAHHQVGSTSPRSKGEEGRLQELLKVTTGELDLNIFSTCLLFNLNLDKTNFFKKDKVAMSFKFKTSFFEDSDYPDSPYSLYFFVGSDFRGFHVRFEDISRGGIRMIKSRDVQAYVRNAETLFEENYALAHTQQRKNKDIPEGGSKGTILLGLGRQEFPFMAFKKYIDSFLDLLLPSDEIVDLTGAKDLIFCGPDEGTADYMDWAAFHARSRGYAFWSAFTTGKSPSLGGIPHDTYGMTTRGVHQYVLGIMDKLGLDESQVTKLQTGGPDGDLGSNEIKISRDKTIAIVDGSGVLFDPSGIDRTELGKLANERKMISFFDRSKIGPGGFVVLLDDTDVTLPDGTLVASGLSFRNGFHLNPLARAMFFVPCGGRPEAINRQNVDQLFDIDPATSAKIPRFSYIVEGANLFFTQEARTVLEKAGVIMYKDASANKGGVTSSSLEVLSSLALTPEEYDTHMRVKEGNIPTFYSDYVKLVQERIEENARFEFECIWKEHLRSGTPRTELTNIISVKINTLNNAISKSGIWENISVRHKVFREALPPLLVELVGFEKIVERIPQEYLRAIFSSHLASRYIYQYGLESSEFAFFEYMQKYL